MNITVEIKCPELAAAIETLAAAMASRGAISPANLTKLLEETPAADAKPEKPARAPAAGKKPTTPPTSEPETDAGAGDTATDEQTSARSSSDDASAADEAGGEAISYDVVKKAVMDLALAKGRGAVVELLAEFKVPDGKKADAIPEARWPEFVKRAAEIMG